MSNKAVLVFIAILGVALGLAQTDSAWSISSWTIGLLFVAFFVSSDVETNVLKKLGEVAIVFFTCLWSSVAIVTLLTKNFCN